MAGSHVALEGSERGRGPDAAHVGDADPASSVEVTVTLRRPERWRDDAEAVKRALARFGLVVAAEYPATGSVVLTGTAAQVEAAFRTRLKVYSHQRDGQLRGREGGLEIPEELDGIVNGVFGLDQRRVAHRLAAAAAGTAAAGTAAGAAATSAAPDPLRPADLEKRYRFPDGDCTGQTIAIAEFGGGYFPDDVSKFCDLYGRALPQIETVSVGTTPLTPAQIAALSADAQGPALGESHEVMMDVEIIAGLCAGAGVSVFFAPFDQKGWVDLLDRVVAADPPPVTLCVSWGLAEDSPDWSPAAVEAINQRLEAASGRGITVCVAAGDDGSGDQMHDEHAHVHFPASSPFVLAVGGTMLDGEQEVVWWNAPGDRSQPRGGSTGGGVSVRFARPQWQDVHVPSVNAGAIDGRVVPDVAALAGLPGYALVFNGQPTMNGGTSAAAPLWSALVARIAGAADPAHPAGPAGPAGPADPAHPARPAGAPPRKPAFLAPLLYEQGHDGRARGAAACVDVTQGNNVSPQPGVGYHAGPGYDAVSGWGVPDGRALRDSLA
ncbi:MAG TPA: S53 family peptidase [Solirubrobacteraceae bacterium]|nr:S53 family peptidase [Solirubrobacteraceae bacterium]